MGPLIEDLRFCIGAFFLIVGALLTVQGILVNTAEINLNLWTGFVFLIFGGGAVTLSLRGATFKPAKKEASTKKEKPLAKPKTPRR